MAMACHGASCHGMSCRRITFGWLGRKTLRSRWVVQYYRLHTVNIGRVSSCHLELPGSSVIISAGRSPPQRGAREMTMCSPPDSIESCPDQAPRVARYATNFSPFLSSLGADVSHLRSLFFLSRAMRATARATFSPRGGANRPLPMRRKDIHLLLLSTRRRGTHISRRSRVPVIQWRKRWQLAVACLTHARPAGARPTLAQCSATAAESFQPSVGAVRALGP